MYEAYLDFDDLKDAILVRANKILNPIIIDIETTGLNPTTDRIIAIGALYRGQKQIFMEPNEEKMLRLFYKYTQENKVLSFIGFNAFFDYGFIRFRSLIHNVPAINIYVKDLRAALFSNYNGFLQTKGTGLNEVCQALGMNMDGEDNDGFDGSEIPTLYEKKQYDLIRKHLEFDLKKTDFLFKKMLECGMLA